MNELHKALGDISSIRQQVAQSTQFRGYGPVTLAATGLFAFGGAIVQAFRIHDPANHLGSYLCVWITTAILSAALSGRQMYTRSQRLHSGLSDEMIRMAVEQFLPAVAAGALTTLVLAIYVPSVAWILPGLWQIVFSLGIFSSLRFLPKGIVVAAAWYLFTGLFCLSLGSARALSPWAMALPFGVGQFLVAGILFLTTREGSDAE